MLAEACGEVIVWCDGVVQDISSGGCDKTVWVGHCDFFRLFSLNFVRVVILFSFRSRVIFDGGGGAGRLDIKRFSLYTKEREKRKKEGFSREV